jgi:hypothetical protein
VRAPQVETEGSGISNIDPFALQGDDWISNFNNLSSAHLPVTPFASEPFTNPFTSPFAPGSANVVPSKIDEMLQDDGHRMLQYTVTVKAVLNNVPARFKLRDQAGHEGLRQDLAKHYKVEEGAHVTAQYAPRGLTAMKKLRIVIFRVWHGATENVP